MKINEILITGYDDGRAVFAANLTPGRATSVNTTEGAEGEPVVDSVRDVVTDAFVTVMNGLAELGLVADATAR